MAINSLSSASKGLSGLASGMDTQSMVDAMLAGTQAKIDKQKQQKTVLGYKQTMYRDIWSSLKSMQDSYMAFGTNSKTNLLSSGFYNTMNAVTKAAAFKVSGSSNANAGKTQINAIHQLAKAATVRSGAGMEVSGAVSGVLDVSKVVDGQELRITLDGVTKTISMPKATAGGATLTEAEFTDQLAESIQRSFGNGIKVNYDSGNGLLTFEATDKSREFVVRGTASSMDVLGLPNGVSNKINTGLLLGDTNFASPLSGEKFEFSINGEQFSFTKDNTVSEVMTAVNRSNAGVKMRYSALDDKFILESTVSGKGATIEMEQTEGNLLTSMFGAVKGGGAATGSQLIVYGDMTGKVGGFPTYTPGTPITAEDKEEMDKALETLEKQLNEITATTDYKLKMMVDGTEVEITLPKREPIDPSDPDSPLKEYKYSDLIDKINADTTLQSKGIQVTMETGTDVDGNTVFTGGIKLSANKGVKVSLDSAAQVVLGLGSGNGTVAGKTDTLASLGGSGSYNVALTWQNPDGTIGSAPTILTPNMTMEEAAQKIQDALVAAGNLDAKVEFNTEDSGKGRFRIFGVDIPMTIGISGVAAGDPPLMGQTYIELNSSNGIPLDKTEGQNAILDINGIRVERNSNDFTVDGLSYELKEVFNSTDNGNGVFTVTDNKAAEDIMVTRDTDQIVDGIKKFMEDYNKILEKSWGLLKSDATYRDYAPLTDKQKEAMSDREIELWEKKSQEGLLRGDPTVEGIMNAMRRALLNKPAGSKYSLAELGIETSYDMDKGFGGKLVFSEGGEDKLREILTQEPEEVEKLFAGSDGLLVEMNKVLRGATSESSMNKDEQIDYANLSLANLAGRPGFPDTSSSIYKQITDINKNLKNLELKYKSEYTRYWKQYTQMEQLISNMNQQSSWLSQQFQ